MIKKLSDSLSLRSGYAIPVRLSVFVPGKSIGFADAKDTQSHRDYQKEKNLSEKKPAEAGKNHSSNSDPKGSNYVNRMRQLAD